MAVRGGLYPRAREPGAHGRLRRGTGDLVRVPSPALSARGVLRVSGSGMGDDRFSGRHSSFRRRPEPLPRPLRRCRRLSLGGDRDAFHGSSADRSRSGHPGGCVLPDCADDAVRGSLPPRARPCARRRPAGRAEPALGTAL